VSTRMSAWDSVERKGAALFKFPPHIAILALTFFVNIPLINPEVHGDGVGYYAYLRAPAPRVRRQFART